MPRPPIVGLADPRLDGFLTAGWSAPDDAVAAVAEIVAGVRERGDAALVDYARRFDDPTFDMRALRVPIPMPAQAQALVPDAVANALRLAQERIARFHEHQRRADVEYEESDGTRYAYVTRPLESVAAYVPAGSAPLPSTALMTVVPAKIAGVARVVLLTPPQRSGRVDPAVLFAASICGADELYAVGGAQAIAAAAFGTQSILPVDKIVGPGNVWVTEAKRQVAGTCAIDGLAGPSEVLVLADDAASPVLVAGELLAQAEHDPRARVAAASQSMALLERVAEELERETARRRARSEIVNGVIAARCLLVHARDLSELCSVAERFAPEHLSLRLGDADRVLARVRNAGAIFIGEYTPVACGDYLAGTNHVLPTSGSARFASGLSLADFTRSFAVVRNTAERIRKDAPAIEALASFEGLEEHARAARLAAEHAG
jgi:histidinol dehydrogenase